MSKIQKLNLGSKFRDFLSSRSIRRTPYDKSCDEVAQLVSEAQTFLLPDNGAYSVGQSKIPAEFAPNFRLPFPTTTFEFTDVYGDGSRFDTLLIAREVINEDTGVRRIIVVTVLGKDGIWVLNPIIGGWDMGSVWTVTQQEYEHSCASEAAMRAIDPLVQVGKPSPGERVLDFRTLRMFDSAELGITPEEKDHLEKMAYPAQAALSIRIVAHACLIMSCRNVKVVDVPLTAGDRYMNDKRRRKGLTPFVEYKVLQLGDKNIYANSNGGTHESPKWHMVMGFVRRLTDDKYYTADTPMEERTRTTFVASHARGNADKGKIVKDYQLTVPPR